MDCPTNDDEEANEKPSSLLVAKASVKSRSSNCLMDPAINPWLPGLNLSPTTNDWTNVNMDSSRPSRDETSSHSNSNYEQGNEQWASERISSDKQRLKGSKRKKKAGKKQKDKTLLSLEKDKEEEQLSPLGRKIIVFVAVSLFLLCILLVGVTLRLGPLIDEMVRKGNEEIYRSMSVGASTSSPTTEDAAVANSTPPGGTPG